MKFNPNDYVTKVVLETQKYFNGDTIRFLVPDEELVVEGEVYALYKCDNGEWCYNIKSHQGIFNDISQGDIIEKVEKPIDKDDRVEHPSYYQLKGGIEVMDIVKYMDFCLGNSIKYILRSSKKGEMGMSQKEKTIEDLKKAIYYLNEEIELLKEDDYE